MSFLAPIFLLGGAAVLGPLLFHLIRRQSRNRKVFSSLLFLSATPPRLNRRSRLEHLLLFALRCLVLVLLAAGFARPFFKSGSSDRPAGEGQRRTLVLLDTSASMRRAGVWSQAQKTAENLLRQAAQNECAVYTFDRQLKPLLTFAEWRALPVSERSGVVSSRLKDKEPGWLDTRVANALISAGELLGEAQSAGTPGRIVVVSDFQEGSKVQGLQAHEWPRGVEVVFEPVKAKTGNNASLHLAGLSEREATSVRVVINNAADSKREEFRVGWARKDQDVFLGEAQTVYVPAGQSRNLELPSSDAGPHERILLQGDDEPFDNAVYVMPPQPKLIQVLYVGDEADNDTAEPFYFLRRALKDTPGQRFELKRLSGKAPLGPEELSMADFLVISGPISAENAGLLKAQLAVGKTGLLIVRSEAAGTSLGLLLGDGVKATEIRPPQYAMLGQLEFGHPLLAPFADPRFSDFTKIHFWKYQRLEFAGPTQPRVLAKFDSGAPALLEAAVGKGRLWVLASGWEPGNSQLALSSKFIPLIYSMLEQSGAGALSVPSFVTGDEVALTGHASVPVGVVTPNNNQVALKPGQTNFTETLLPGVYSVIAGASTNALWRFAVNLDVAESRTVPLSLDEFEKLGVPVAHGESRARFAEQQRVHALNQEVEARQKFWRWLLSAAVLVLFLETWLGGRTLRRLRSVTEEVAK